MEVLLMINPEIVKNINMNDLYEYLNKYDILTRSEREHLDQQSSKTLTEKTKYLMSALETKSPEALQNFVKALYDSSSMRNGHQLLIETLQKHGVVVDEILADTSLSTEIQLMANVMYKQ